MSILFFFIFLLDSSCERLGLLHFLDSKGIYCEQICDFIIKTFMFLFLQLFSFPL